MTTAHLLEEELTRSIIGAFFEVYNTLGFGFLEHIYILALEIELGNRGHQVRREVRVCVTYKGQELAHQRMDMIVDEKVIVETKSTYDLHRAATRQLFNYVRATNIEVGLLFHFGPRPKFYRAIYRNAVNRSAASARSASSVQTFVIDAGPSSRRSRPK